MHKKGQVSIIAVAVIRVLLLIFGSQLFYVIKTGDDGMPLIIGNN